MKKRRLIIVIVMLLLACAGTAKVLVDMHAETVAADRAAAEAAAGEVVRIEATVAKPGNYELARTFATGELRAVVVDFKTNSSVRMVEYLQDAGYIAVRIDDIDDLNVDDYDLLVIPGGGNITPSVYGAKRDKETYNTNLAKDKLQIAAVRMFAEQGKPILGICRGCQLVNVAFGGTLHQHIPGWHKKYRTVTIDESSWLYPVYGDAASVYHSHHQCIDRLGEGLYATQWDAKDGRIEAIEHETLPVYALQWHPDLMGEEGVEVLRLFKFLVYEDMLNDASA